MILAYLIYILLWTYSYLYIKYKYSNSNGEQLKIKLWVILIPILCLFIPLVNIGFGIGLWICLHLYCLRTRDKTVYRFNGELESKRFSDIVYGFDVVKTNEFITYISTNVTPIELVANYWEDPFRFPSPYDNKAIIRNYSIVRPNFEENFGPFRVWKSIKNFFGITVRNIFNQGI